LPAGVALWLVSLRIPGNSDFWRNDPPAQSSEAFCLMLEEFTEKIAPPSGRCRRARQVGFSATNYANSRTLEAKK
jgi:hypothetical protein